MLCNARLFKCSLGFAMSKMDNSTWLSFFLRSQGMKNDF